MFVNCNYPVLLNATVEQSADRKTIGNVVMYSNYWHKV